MKYFALFVFLNEVTNGNDQGWSKINMGRLMEILADRGGHSV
jgi:hypothetical protein